MNGDTLKIYDDGTFQYFIDRCELEIVGSWSTSRNSKNRKRMELERCQTSGLCAAVEAFCDNPFWKSLATGTSATNLLCAAIELSMCYVKFVHSRTDTVRGYDTASISLFVFI